MTNRDRWLTILVIAVLPLAVPLFTLAAIIYHYDPGKWSVPILIMLLGTQAAICYGIMAVLAVAALITTLLIGESGRYLRTLLGFILAPLVIPLALWLYFLQQPDAYGIAEAVVEVVTAVSFATMVVIGAPSYIALRRLGRTSLLTTLLWGVGVTIAGKLAFTNWAQVHSDWREALRIAYDSLTEDPVLYIWWLGLIVGLVFWLLVRPDRANSLSTPH